GGRYLPTADTTRGGGRRLLGPSGAAVELRGLDTRERAPSAAGGDRRQDEPQGKGGRGPAASEPLQQGDRQQAAHVRAHREVPCFQSSCQVWRSAARGLDAP